MNRQEAVAVTEFSQMEIRLDRLLENEVVEDDTKAYVEEALTAISAARCAVKANAEVEA